MRTNSILTVAFLLAVPLATGAESEKPVNWGDGLPEPFHTELATNRPNVVERPDGANLSLPEGFKVEEYLSGDFVRPRYMLLGPSEELVFSDSGSRNQPDGAVYVSQGQGKTKKLIEGLDRPYGLALHDGWLYVAEPTSVKRYRYDAKEMAVGEGEEIISYAGHGRGHWTRCSSMKTTASSTSLLVRPRTSTLGRLRCAPPCTATTRTAAVMRLLPPASATSSA